MVVALAREPQPILVDADPNGLAFDAGTERLYLTDSRGAVLCADGDVVDELVRMPAKLGGIATTPWGALYVARVGHGRDGAVLRISPEGSVDELPGIDPRFSRLGLAYDPDTHVLYSTQYLKSATGPYGGAIAAIGLASGAVAVLATGFAKPVGIARLGDTLVVSDACARRVVALTLAGGQVVGRHVLADDLARPDSLCACGRDSVLVTTFDGCEGAVHRVWLDGRSRVIARGPWQPRGVACDGRQAYVAWRRGGQILVFDL